MKGPGRPGGRWISLKETAEHLGVSERTVRRLIANGILPGYRLPSSGKGYGHLVRLDRNDVDALLKRIPTVDTGRDCGGTK